MSPDPVMVTTPIWDKAVLGLKALYWVIIGAITVIVIVAIFAILRLCRHSSHVEPQHSINIANI